MDMFEYSNIADEHIAVIFLIEHPEALKNLDELLSVPGIDIAAAVPFDLAVNMGYRDGPGHPDVQKALAETNNIADDISHASVPVTRYATDHSERLAI